MIDAVEDLYLRDRTPQDAAQALLDLSHGSKLGARALLLSAPAAAGLQALLHAQRPHVAVHGPVHLMRGLEQVSADCFSVPPGCRRVACTGDRSLMGCCVLPAALQGVQSSPRDHTQVSWRRWRTSWACSSAGSRSRC